MMKSPKPTTPNPLLAFRGVQSNLLDSAQKTVVACRTSIRAIDRQLADAGEQIPTHSPGQMDAFGEHTPGSVESGNAELREKQAAKAQRVLLKRVSSLLDNRRKDPTFRVIEPTFADHRKVGRAVREARERLIKAVQAAFDESPQDARQETELLLFELASLLTTPGTSTKAIRLTKTELEPAPAPARKTAPKRNHSDRRTAVA
ncbi:MAG: hypothetical protein GC208_10465 [Alphaproteobacteria bacterium]|nr:hypothetical protein [Alphaproteobacteria bacterium]